MIRKWVEFLMLDDVTTAVPLCLVGFYLASFPVGWNFQRLERKYGLRTLEIINFWRLEVQTSGIWVIALGVPAILGWLLGHWVVWAAAGFVLLVYIGSAMTSRRLRLMAEAHPTIWGTAAKVVEHVEDE